MRHKVRELLVSQRTRLVNALGGHLAEVGIIAAQGSNGAYALAAASFEGDTIGVDVSKHHLDAQRLADGATRRFANDKGGHKALIKWLTETPLYRVVFEPTGPYHRAVERALGIAGVPFVKVNPRQARRFAEATGKLAKTDRLDAAILARMGAMLELEARPARSELLAFPRFLAAIRSFTRASRAT